MPVARFDYNPNGQFENLGVGETASDTFTYTIDDGRGQPNSTDYRHRHRHDQRP